jgi:hypothetical protein
VKMMGLTGRDLNKSRGSWVSRVRTIAHCWAIVRPRDSVSVRLRLRLGTNVRPRALASERTIAQGGAIVRFLSVFSTFWRTYANDRSLMGERSLP